MQNQLHLVANTAATAGGEGVAAWRYAESLVKAGCAVTLLSMDEPDKHTNADSIPMQNFARQVVPTRSGFLLELVKQYSFLHNLCKQKKFDLIHLHGMWTPFLAISAFVAWRMGIPLVISPHGCLEPRALEFKPFKKWLALRIYQGRVLRLASLFVATAERELDSIRRSGYLQPVAVIPNGVDVGSPPHRKMQEGKKTILFLSRIHPIKGLLDLVEAWAVVRSPSWRIVIAGGDEEGYRAKVEALIRAKGLQADFEFVGFVEGGRKQDCFDLADIFILPTYSENFGIAVAEALANELPVITTKGAPWSDLEEYRCGWWVEPGVKGISDALMEALSCDPLELMEMGRRGRRLVQNKYSWNKIGETASEVSTWLLEPSRPRPEAVREYKQ